MREIHVEKLCDRYREERGSCVNKVSGCRILATTFRQLICERSLQLLYPLTFWLGLEQAFMIADYTAVSLRAEVSLLDTLHFTPYLLLTYYNVVL